MDHQTFKISLFASSLLLGVSSIASTAVYKEALRQVDWQAREQELTSLFLPRNFSAQYGPTSDSLSDLLTYPIDKEKCRNKNIPEEFVDYLDIMSRILFLEKAARFQSPDANQFINALNQRVREISEAKYDNLRNKIYKIEDKLFELGNRPLSKSIRKPGTDEYFDDVDQIRNYVQSLRQGMTQEFNSFMRVPDQLGDELRSRFRQCFDSLDQRMDDASDFTPVRSLPDRIKTAFDLHYRNYLEASCLELPHHQYSPEILCFLHSFGLDEATPIMIFDPRKAIHRLVFKPGQLEQLMAIRSGDKETRRTKVENYFATFGDIAFGKHDYDQQRNVHDPEEKLKKEFMECLAEGLNDANERDYVLYIMAVWTTPQTPFDKVLDLIAALCGGMYEVVKQQDKRSVITTEVDSEKNGPGISFNGFHKTRLLMSLGELGNIYVMNPRGEAREIRTKPYSKYMHEFTHSGDPTLYFSSDSLTAYTDLTLDKMSNVMQFSLEKPFPENDSNELVDGYKNLLRPDDSFKQPEATKLHWNHSASEIKVVLGFDIPNLAGKPTLVVYPTSDYLRVGRNNYISPLTVNHVKVQYKTFTDSKNQKVSWLNIYGDFIHRVMNYYKQQRAH